MTNKSYSICQNIGTLEENAMFSCGYTVEPILPSNPHDLLIPYFSCFLLLDGFGSFQNSNNLHAILSRGIFVQRYPDVSHQITIDTTRYWKSFYISLDQAFYHSLVILGILNPKEPIRKCHITKSLLLSFDELAYEYKYMNEITRFPLMQKLQRCIYDIMTQTLETPTLSPIIEKAKEILSCNFSIVYTEKDICELLCIGEESFRKQFRKEAGISPMAYRNQQRMLTAKKLLATQNSVAEVAYSLGYSDSFSFSKQFKRHWEMSPNAFRKTLTPNEVI